MSTGVGEYTSLSRPFAVVVVVDLVAPISGRRAGGQLERAPDRHPECQQHNMLGGWDGKEFRVVTLPS